MIAPQRRPAGLATSGGETGPTAAGPDELTSVTPARPGGTGRRREGWQDGMVTAPTFFDAVGGEPTFRRLVDKFYEGVAEDPLLRPMYPEEDLGPAADRFALFLMQYWGGPNTYSRSAAIPGCGCGTRRSGSTRPRGMPGCATCGWRWTRSA